MMLIAVVQKDVQCPTGTHEMRKGKNCPVQVALQMWGGQWRFEKMVRNLKIIWQGSDPDYVSKEAGPITPLSY